MKNKPWGVSMRNLGCHTMDGGKTTENRRGTGEEGRKFAGVISGQSLLLTKGSWNGFRIS